MILEIAIVFILSQLIFGFILWYNVKDLYRFPNNFGFPVIGTLYYFYKGFCFKSLHSMYFYMRDASDEIGNGIYFAYLKGKKSAVISCPHIIEEVAFKPGIQDKAHNVYGTVNPLIRGMFTYSPTDSEWKERRKEFNSTSTKTIIDSRYFQYFKNSSRLIVEGFNKEQERVKLDFHCINGAINTIKEAYFGVENPKFGNRHFINTWILLLSGVSLIFANPFVSLIFSLIYKIFDIFLMKKVNVVLEEAGSKISQLKKVLKDTSAEPGYLPLSMLITLRNKNRKLSTLELKKELYELLVAGSHTISSILVNILAVCATHPEIQDKLWREQYEIFGASNRDLTIEDLKKMPYLEKFLKESLRYFGPGLVVKYTTAEVKAAGVTIPPGTVIYMTVGKPQMDPKIWNDPLKFDPERVFENKPKYSYSVFGVGIRSCPGMYFSLQYLKTTISTVMRKYKLSSRQKFEDFIFESQLLPEIINLKPIQVEERIYG